MMEDENDILAITFTRNTANDLKKKLADLNMEGVSVGTFHSICNQLLRREGKGVEQRHQIQEWQKENIFKKLDKKANVNNISGFISYQKNYMIGVDEEFRKYESNYTVDELREFYRAYENFKEEMDYLILMIY